MEETKLQALADSLTKHGGRKGLGTYGGQYSWSKQANVAGEDGERTDGLPTNALYSNFVKAGLYDPTKKTPVNHGDGRFIKRDFSDIPVLVEDDSADKNRKLTKEERKAAKKAAKIEAKKQAKLEEKRRLKRLAKEEKKGRKSVASVEKLETDSLEPRRKKRKQNELEGSTRDENTSGKVSGKKKMKKEKRRDKKKSAEVEAGRKPSLEGGREAKKLEFGKTKQSSIDSPTKKEKKPSARSSSSKKKKQKKQKR